MKTIMSIKQKERGIKVYKTLIFGVFSVVIAKVAYEQGVKKGIDNQRHEYYHQGYELGKFVGELKEKYRED